MVFDVSDFRARKTMILYQDSFSDEKTTIPEKVNGKSKTIFLALNASGLGFLGVDRIYSNSVDSGLLKAGLFVLGLLLYQIEKAIGIFFLSLWLIWCVFDAFKVIKNGVTKSRESPYSNESFKDNEIEVSYYLTFVLLFFYFCIQPLISILIISNL